MWSSTGNFPPTGLLDGQFSDLGSYRGCVDLNIPQRDSLEQVIKYTSYCTIPFRAIVPSRKPFHFITNEGNEQLANVFNHHDVFNFFANKSQYFHYIYIKTGICIPSDCSSEDIQQVTNLVAKRLILMPGPVECFTRAPQKANYHSQMNLTGKQINVQDEYDFSKIENKPITVEVDKPMNSKQLISIISIGTFFSLVFSATIWHAADNLIQIVLKPGQNCHNNDGNDSDYRDEQTNGESNSREKIELIVEHGRFKHIAFEYFSLITNWKDFINVTLKSTEIKCLHGLRVVTCLWIMLVHTLQYNDWSGFTRIYENTQTLTNIILQPIYNANYSVDNFFLMSGLLIAYTTWYSNKGTPYNFSFKTSLIGRYLRLTPQVFLISLAYIALPLIGDGPFWFDVTNHAAKYCEKNWWINLLHLQAFYREDEMCNLVSWWISVDMFYYILALGIVYMILNNFKKTALISTILLVIICSTVTVFKHFHGNFTPNNLANVPQVAEVWTKFVVEFFWSPYPHAYPYFLGLWTGYILANNMWSSFIIRWSKLGWIVTTVSLITVSLSSHIWISGKVEPDNQYISTAYNSICPIVWSSALAYFIMACHYGCAPRLNKLLSGKFVVLISKASFIIYLSHMLIVRSYYGLQNSLLEVSIISLLYIIVGNIFLSTMFGVFLHVAFELPCMKLQSKIVNRLKPKSTLTSAPFASTLVVQSINQDGFKSTGKLGPTSESLLES